MWIRIKHSLTLRIFLMTCGLMIAVCAATYGAIAYLTPLIPVFSKRSSIKRPKRS